MQDTLHNSDLPMIEPVVSFDELSVNFQLFDDWEDRYRYIIDLGKKLPKFPEALKTDIYKVRGCMSQVWIIPGHVEGDVDRFAFAADSDAHIVKGLIHALATLYTGKSMKDVMGIDAEAAFAKLGLDQHLSPSRRNGVASMVGRIRKSAAS